MAEAPRAVTKAVTQTGEGVLGDYNTRDGEGGKKNYKEEELIDWVQVQHDDSAKVVEATQSAIRYLRALKQGIPIPEVGNFVEDAQAAGAGGSADAAAEEDGV